MTDVVDIIDDNFPANEDVGVPLLSTIWILFNQAMDEDSISNAMFIEGPDTDQFVGPGLFGLQQYPNNISENDLDDFLKSPGYKGIVQGTFTFQNIDPNDSSTVVASGVTPYRTKAIFTPTQPLVANTEYTVLISDTDNSLGTTYTGITTFSFTTGSGSIQTLPSSVSTSVLSAASTGSYGQTTNATGDTTIALAVTSTSPNDDTVEQSTSLSEITVTFNKNLSSVNSAGITVVTTNVSDHPAAAANAIGTLAKTVEIEGNKLKIKI